MPPPFRAGLHRAQATSAPAVKPTARSQASHRARRPSRRRPAAALLAGTTVALAVSLPGSLTALEEAGMAATTPTAAGVQAAVPAPVAPRTAASRALDAAPSPDTARLLSEQTRRSAEAKRTSRQQRNARVAERQRTERARAAQEAEQTRWVAPLAGYRLTSGFGARWGRQHAGTDLAAPIGVRVRAISRGTVIFAGAQSGYGNKVEIEHWDGTVSYYAHMSEIDVRVGETVDAGEKVGEVGNTGRSTGPHLHLQVLPNGQAAVDARRWLAAHGVQL